MTGNLNAPPSKNPANSDSMAGAFQTILTKFLQGIDNMLPAKVISYDRSTNVALVQPLIQFITTLNQEVSRAQVSIPVLQMGGNGFLISFPITAGDLGWIHASDRDISIFKQTLEQSPPNTHRKHSFSDGMFIPDTMFDHVMIAAEDVNNAVFQNEDGTVKVALWPSQLKVVAPNSCITDTPGHSPNPSAVLDLASTTRAFLVPRMTHGQRDAIPSPIGGMMVYLTDSPTGFSSYTDGIGWG